jgi:hypothetical protein
MYPSQSTSCAGPVAFCQPLDPARSINLAPRPVAEAIAGVPVDLPQAAPGGEGHGPNQCYASALSPIPRSRDESSRIMTPIPEAFVFDPPPAGLGKTESTDPEQISAFSFLPSVLSAAELEILEIPARECLVGTWWREGAQGFLYGPRGLGKTWLGFHLARCLAEGRNCGPWKITKARRTLYVDGEMPLDGLRERDRALREQPDAPLLVLSADQHFRKAGRGLNLTAPESQAALLETCKAHKIEVLFLDNLSCLFSGIRENDADDWGSVQPWLMTMRRMGIAVCIIHHSGRNGAHMRGTTKREDASSWVMGLAAPSMPDDTGGARFVGRFTKNREGDETEAGPWQWTFQTEDGKTTIRHERMEHLEMFLQHVRDGLSSCKDIAEEMNVSKGTVSKWAKRAADKKLIRIDDKRGYVACD